MKKPKVSVVTQVQLSRCPYCREELSQDFRSLVHCSRCFTFSHADCFEESQSCSVFGCKGTVTDTPIELPRALRLKSREPDNLKEQIWLPIWILLYITCIFIYLALG